jgi:NAD+ kinase
VRDAIGLLFHPRVQRQQRALAEARQLLESRDVPHWEGTRDTTSRGLARQLRRTRLILTLGGDGTFLYGARMAAPQGIPVLGVNLGRLGFLTEVDVGELETGLKRFLSGDYRVEERTVLSFVLVRREKAVLRSLGINEVVVHKGGSSKLIRLELQLDHQEVGTIDADGVVIASATGSTAYALASGGPILEPELRDIVLAPMNPFALSVRPIVFSPGTEISIALPRGTAMLTVDGFLNRRLAAGDCVKVRAYDRSLKVVRFGPQETFFRMLRQKIGWGTPLVPRENTPSSDAS